MQRNRRETFKATIKTAVGQLGPGVQGDSGKLDVDALGKAVGDSHLWLSPCFVSDFRSDDFSDLEPEKLRELTSHVSNYQAIASQDFSSASKQKLIAAARSLLQVADILGIS